MNDVVIEYSFGFRYDAELLVAQGYTLCNSNGKPSSEESSNDTGAPATKKQTTKRRRLKNDNSRKKTVSSSEPIHNEISNNNQPERRSLRTRSVRKDANVKDNPATQSSGPTANGSTTNGVTTNGATTNCATTNGVTSNGVTTNGVTTNGVTTNSVTTNGMRLRNHKTLVEMVSLLPSESSTSNNTTNTTSNSTSSSTSSSRIEPELVPELEPELESDVYEFNDSDRETGNDLSGPAAVEPKLNEPEEPRSLTPPPSNPSPGSSCQPALISSPSGRLKLTLRMKRSPVLDEVIESGNIMDPHPVYEVLRVEGLTEDEAELADKSSQHAKSKHQRRSRRKYAEKHRNVVMPTTKRLRLIFGNESHTIDLPPSNLSTFPSVE